MNRPDAERCVAGKKKWQQKEPSEKAKGDVSAREKANASSRGRYPRHSIFYFYFRPEGFCLCPGSPSYHGPREAPRAVEAIPMPSERHVTMGILWKLASLVRVPFFVPVSVCANEFRERNAPVSPITSLVKLKSHCHTSR